MINNRSDRGGNGTKSNQIKFIYIALRTSADISKCCTETQPKTPNSKQCRCRSTHFMFNRQRETERILYNKRFRCHEVSVAGASKSGAGEQR